MNRSIGKNSFLQDSLIYVGRFSQFNRMDWLSYVAWVGLMSGLFLATSGFVLQGWYQGVVFPAYVWNVPIGTAIFVAAIAFDTIGHRTIYKQELEKGEALVHHVTIFAGITSCFALCLAYRWPVFMEIPTAVFILLSILYSLIDEALHWRRYLNGHSDRVEMWSHFFIFVGHLIMIGSWWKWYAAGYPGVEQTLAALH